MPELSEFTLYHRAVQDVRGHDLMPLNELRGAYADVYEREVKKYAGREVLQQEEVLPLGCLWGDVLFLSPVHPKLLLDAVRDTGREIPPVRFWAVNAAILQPERTIIKFVQPWANGVYTPPVVANYAPFTSDILSGVSVPGVETLDRLAKLSATDPLILWSDVPHVLYRGQLALSALQEVWA